VQNRETPLQPRAPTEALPGKKWGWLRLMVALVLLAILAWRLDWQEVWRIATEADVALVGLALVIMILILVPRVSRWRVLLTTLGIRLPFPRYVAIYLVGDFFNNFLPSSIGGDSMRMLWLARDTKSGTAAISSVVVERLGGLFAGLLMGVVAVLSRWQMASSGAVRILVLIAFAAFVLGIAILLSLRGVMTKASRVTLPWLSVVVRKVDEIYDSVTSFREHPQALLVALLYSLVFRLIQASSVYVQAQALHVQVPFLWLLMVMSLISVVSSVPLSLNALGIQEGAYVFFFGLVGVPAPQAMTLALLGRILRMAASLPGGIVYVLAK